MFSRKRPEKPKIFQRNEWKYLVRLVFAVKMTPRMNPQRSAGHFSEKLQWPDLPQLLRSSGRMRRWNLKIWPVLWLQHTFFRFLFWYLKSTFLHMRKPFHSGLAIKVFLSKWAMFNFSFGRWSSITASNQSWGVFAKTAPNKSCGTLWLQMGCHFDRKDHAHKILSFVPLKNP